VSPPYLAPPYKIVDPQLHINDAALHYSRIRSIQFLKLFRSYVSANPFFVFVPSSAPPLPLFSPFLPSIFLPQKISYCFVH